MQAGKYNASEDCSNSASSPSPPRAQSPVRNRGFSMIAAVGASAASSSSHTHTARVAASPSPTASERGRLARMPSSYLPGVGVPLSPEIQKEIEALRDVHQDRNTWRGFIYWTLEEPSMSRFARAYSMFMMSLILLATLCFVLESEATSSVGIFYGSDALVRSTPDAAFALDAHVAASILDARSTSTAR
jgi:hypothetical protein